MVENNQSRISTPDFIGRTWHKRDDNHMTVSLKINHHLFLNNMIKINIEQDDGYTVQILGDI